MEKKVVLITGCSNGGIGSHLAQQFSLSNCQVFATSTSKSKMSDLEPFGCHLLELNVLEVNSVELAVEEVIKRAGKIDILINNAGVTVSAPLIETNIEQVNHTYQTNILGLLRVTQKVTPYMIEAKSGTVVNIGSIAGEINTPYSGTYSSSKAAVTSLTRVLRLELAPFGIDTLLVKPGAVKSNIGKNNLLFKNESNNEFQLYQNVQGYILKRANISQNTACMETSYFAKKVVSHILRRSSPTYQYYRFLSNPFNVLLFVLANLIGLVIPSLRPSMSYFKNKFWALPGEIVYGGQWTMPYFVALFPAYIVNFVQWVSFGLGYVN
ncbi:NAD(P)-binding protein [Conidiobolus coronatus NRRL 28638]|uniref:NAD(P)-binding protein n=1 Tax=Conidiobolus coronatus (strain ATCC 28846 / CBS 209.66 / NRRL 28638) TaxID=796925 RepID=A0A137P3R2_CONC2|nr:NAD(P)-binding protein [Conidiobolus coronatus NRRL 28638]|eukprot:KXN69662.1 NAD(P)-binding protein [Conidiobolus coronatus NRRL 28638]